VLDMAAHIGAGEQVRLICDLVPEPRGSYIISFMVHEAHT
jgi:hypothetical protein